MPDTRLERLIAALGLVAAVALAVFIVRDWPDGHAASATVSTGPASPAVPTTTESTPTTTHALTTAEPATTATTTTTATSTGPVPTLSLTAVHADTWFEVRRGSSTGTLLYSAVLAVGKTRSFDESTPLWLRFGAASNLQVRIGGSPVPLRGGTYDARFANGTLERITG